MIQVLPKVQTFGEKFGTAIGQGLGSGVSKGLESRAQAKKLAQENEQIKQQYGIDLSGITDPDTRKAVMVQELKQQGKQKLAEQSQDYLTRLFGGKGQQPTQPGQEGSPQSQEMPQGLDPSKLSDEDIARATAMDPNLGRSLMHAKDVSLREQRETRNFEESKKQHEAKEITASFGENQKFIDKTYDQYEDSLRKEAILERMDQLEESGNLSDSGTINLLESIGLKSEWLKNPENEEYTKLGLDLLGGGTLQADYGSRVLQSEFKVSQMRIPTLSQTPEGRKQIKENLKTMLLPSKLKNERMQFYLDEAERTGKPLPHNLRGKILKDIKPQLEMEYDKFKQRNGRYKVKSGTIPDDDAIEKYYFIAEGNEKKARVMMEEDGYDVE